MEELVSTGVVARQLGVTINTVKSWIRAGDVEAVRLPGGHFRIPRRELDRLLHRRAPARWEAAAAAVSGGDTSTVEETLAWIDSVLELAEAGGPLPEPPISERIGGLERMRRALRVLER